MRQGFPQSVRVALAVFGLCCGGYAIEVPADLLVYELPVQLRFPNGYDVYDDRGTFLKKVDGPADATVKAKSEGKFVNSIAYLSDWSFERLGKGASPNWIIPIASISKSQTPYLLKEDLGLTVYSECKNKVFENGYRVENDKGDTIKIVPGPASVCLKAEKRNNTYNTSLRYLSDWSFDQLIKGKTPNWIFENQSRNTFNSDEQLNAENKRNDNILLLLKQNKHIIKPVVQEQPFKIESVNLSKDRKLLSVYDGGLIYVYELHAGRLILKKPLSKSDYQNFYECNNQEIKKLFELNISKLGSTIQIVELGNNKYAAFGYEPDDNKLYGGNALLFEGKSGEYIISKITNASSKDILKNLNLPEQLLKKEFSEKIEKNALFSKRTGVVASTYAGPDGVIADSILKFPYQGCFMNEHGRGFIVNTNGVCNIALDGVIKHIDGIDISRDASKLICWGISFQDTALKGNYEFFPSPKDHNNICMPCVVSLNELTATNIPTGDNIVWNCSLSSDGNKVAIVSEDYNSVFHDFRGFTGDYSNISSGVVSPIHNGYPDINLYEINGHDLKTISTSKILYKSNSCPFEMDCFRYIFENRCIDQINALRSTRLVFDSDPSYRDCSRFNYNTKLGTNEILSKNLFNTSDWENFSHSYSYKVVNPSDMISCQWSHQLKKEGEQEKITLVKVKDQQDQVLKELVFNEVDSLIYPLNSNNILVANAIGMRVQSLDDNSIISTWNNPSTGLTSQSIRPMQSVAISNDSKRIIYLSDDSSIHVICYDDNYNLNYFYHFYMMEDRMPLFVLSDNSYMTSHPESTGLHFSDGSHAFPLEQFDLRLNRPDIVLDRLGAPKEAIDAAKSLREKRLKRMGVTEEMLQPDFHLPELQIVGDVLDTTAKDQLNLQIKATDDKYPLDRLRVYVNNVPVNGRDGELLRDQNIQSLEKTIPIKLAVGRNKIQVSVLNSAGVESLYANAEVTCTAERPKPKLYVTALGVSQYENEAVPQLQYAAKDATDLINKIKDKAGPPYSEVKPLLLTDKEVTKESVAKIKEFLSGAAIDDTVLIFMAGHGILDDKYDYYFGTTDIDPAKPSERGMPYEAIDTILAEVPSLKKALLMDTCHAGELDDDEKKELAASEGSATPAAIPTATTNSSPLAGKVAMRSIGSRGMSVRAVQGAKGKSDWYEKLQDMFVDLRRGSGATVISSSQGAEYAFESSEQSNGLFTYALMEALDGKATPNKDGQITISSIGDYVKKRVQDLTKGKQNPNLRGVNLEEDFMLGSTK